jgi:DNA-binding CsgD family transcriptional regulator
MLYGRSAECGLIDDLIEAARRGRSGGLVLRGEAGIGKSVLLRYAAEQAGTARVLELHGVQAESAMPFAGLHALLHPAREHLASLSEPQRRALSAALGLEASEVPSRFLVSAAVLELLATLAEERPVICLVDDAQWVDPQSLSALSFALRRMRGDRLAMLFTFRTESPADQPGGAFAGGSAPHHGGPAGRCRRLAGARRTPGAGPHRPCGGEGGCPLALTVLVPDDRADLPVAPPSLTEHLEADYVRRTAGLDGRVRHLLLLAAADDTGDLAVILAAAHQHGAADLSTAEQRGLLRVDARRVDFTHPLVRSAAYQGAGSTAQREAHLTLALAFAPVDPARATWHRAAAAIAPAEDVAAGLADLAAAAVRRAATDLATRAYGRAAGLTADPERRLAWLLDAAEAAWESGHVERASALLTSAREAATADADPSRVDHLRGRFEAVTGSALQGYEVLLRGAERILDVAPHRAAAMLYAALRTASVAGDMDRVVRTGQAAARLLDSGARPAPACFAAGIADLLTGRGAGAVAMLEEGIREVRNTTDPEVLYMAASVFALDRVHGLAYPAALAVRALGLLELGLGRPTEALLHYDSIAMNRVHRAAQLVAVDLAMVAAVRSGHHDRARTQLETVSAWPWLREADATWAAPTLDRWRAMVSADAEATRLYERSLAGQADSPHSFLAALTHLLLGEHLRRGRQRSAARPHLRTAMETFERLDAVPWAARARTELRASGETVRRHENAIRLTPQELQVAQLVATGASTKSVAAQLYLSPRTVDSHLRQIFSKLGISSRAALRDVDLAG